MKRITCIVLMTAFSFMSLGAVEEPTQEASDNLSSLLEAMDKKEKNIKTISCVFSQSLEISYTGEQEKIRGKAYFKKPDHIRIEQIKPDKNVFITDGKQAWYYAPAQKQVMQGPWDSVESESSSFFRGLLNLSESFKSTAERYDLSYAGKENRYHIIKLKPLHDEHQKPSFSMRLWIDEIDLLPHKTEMTMEAMVIVTEVDHYTVDKPLPDSLFFFTAPSDVQEMPFP